MILHEDITPGLTNSRKNFCCDPMLKGLCRFKFAAEDERVEAGFVDNCHFLFSTRGHHFSDTFVFYSYMSIDISTTVLVPEVICNIFTYKPRFSINSKSTKISEFRMKVGVEDLDL